MLQDLIAELKTLVDSQYVEAKVHCSSDGRPRTALHHAGAMAVNVSGTEEQAEKLDFLSDLVKEHGHVNGRVSDRMHHESRVNVAVLQPTEQHQRRSR